MKPVVYEKFLVKNTHGKVVVTLGDKEIKEYSSVEGCNDFLWYLMESAVPEQVPYCKICAKNGVKSVIKDGVCVIHKKNKAKYAFKEISKEDADVNIDFVIRNKWIIESLCDANRKNLDSKKVVQGIIDINKNNKTLSLKNIYSKK
ncbi:MAG: hypothetical protein WCX46_03805 [Candidatus Paceibacterota bacterium]